MLGSSLLISSLIAISHAANLVEVLTKHGATKLVDLAVKAGLADTLTGEHHKVIVIVQQKDFHSDLILSAAMMQLNNSCSMSVPNPEKNYISTFKDPIDFKFRSVLHTSIFVMIDDVYCRGRAPDSVCPHQ